MGWYHNGLIKVDIVNGYTTATMMDGNIMGIWMDMIIIYDNIFIIYTEKQCIQPIETGYKTTSNGDIMWIDWKYIYNHTYGTVSVFSFSRNGGFTPSLSLFFWEVPYFWTTMNIYWVHDLHLDATNHTNLPISGT